MLDLARDGGGDSGQVPPFRCLLPPCRGTWGMGREQQHLEVGGTHPLAPLFLALHSHGPVGEMWWREREERVDPATTTDPQPLDGAWQEFPSPLGKQQQWQVGPPTSSLVPCFIPLAVPLQPRTRALASRGYLLHPPLHLLVPLNA